MRYGIISNNFIYTMLSNRLLKSIYSLFTSIEMNIYPENFEQKINFDEIREYLKEKCLSPLGIEKVNEMHFSTDYKYIRKALEQTHEFQQIIACKENFPLNNYLDIRTSLHQIENDLSFWLSEKEIPLLANSLETIAQIVDFLTKKKGQKNEEYTYPELKNMSNDIKTFPNIVERANAILDKSGLIKDNASKLLFSIRKNKFEAEKDITKALAAVLRTAQAQGIIDKDTRGNLRDGHYLIPVTAANKRKIKGIIRDNSGSGKTVFIEPEEVVEASNRFRDLQNDERKEIARILTEFTSSIRPDIVAILRSYNFLAEIDFTQAKAFVALRFNAIKPHFENNQNIEWINATHPLLDIELRKQNKSAHPLDIELTSLNRILIISGVNAGGKSLCLKTVALLQYMLQCGNPIPVTSASRAGVFDHIFMDIGDGQSMENSLSTYTAHLGNMKFILDHNDEKSLILIDEFGGGTEPQIGGAIAESILERFNKKKSFGVITTHFQNLKDYAYKTEGIINGAMLFDAEKNQPMYKLSIGSPGSSFAIEVAKRIGLDKDIISDATQKLGENYINMDRFLQSIAKDKLYWENKKKEIETAYLSKQDAEQEVAQTIEDKTKKVENKPQSIQKEKPLEIGDKVRMEGQSVIGIVIEIKGNQATVSFGSLKSTIKKDRLIPVQNR